jgi:hypothetical protein
MATKKHITHTGERQVESFRYFRVPNRCRSETRRRNSRKRAQRAHQRAESRIRDSGFGIRKERLLTANAFNLYRIASLESRVSTVWSCHSLLTTHCSLRKSCVLLIFALFVAIPSAFAAEAGIADFKHLGVASCATSVCHGKLAPQPNANVALNEYRTWTQEDRHAQAYRTLELPESKRIAANLGLPNAMAA